MTLTDLSAARAVLQNLLDTYQIRDPGMTQFKDALVLIDNVLALPDPVAAEQQVVDASGVVSGLVTALSDQFGQINAKLAALELDATALRTTADVLDSRTAQIVNNTAPTAAA